MRRPFYTMEGGDYVSKQIWKFRWTRRRSWGVAAICASFAVIYFMESVVQKTGVNPWIPFLLFAVCFFVGALLLKTEE